MRRIVTLLAVVAFVFVAGGCKKAKDATVERTGLVNFVAGEVFLIGKDGAEAKAVVGNEVKQGMKIKTIGKKSFADIYFGENAVKVLGDTIVEVQVLVTNLTTNGEESTFHVEKGQFFSKVSQKLAKDDRYTVKSQTTTAGVRGTEFLVAEVDGKGLVACLKGTVEVKNEASPDRGSVDVADKKEVTVEKDREMVVRDLSAENRRLMEDISRNFQDMKRDIRERFEKKREEIRKAVEDQRARNQESVERQKAKDLENVEKQKAKDKENIDRIKGTADKTGTEAREGVERQQQESQQKLESVKPEIKKFKSTVK